MCALNTLANIKAAVGSLENVTRIGMVNGFVNAVDNFSDSPAVINGASELFLAVFGEAGKHARAAVAVNGLPRGTTVEVQVVGCLLSESGFRWVEERFGRVVVLGWPGCWASA